MIKFMFNYLEYHRNKQLNNPLGCFDSLHKAFESLASLLESIGSSKIFHNTLKDIMRTLLFTSIVADNHSIKMKQKPHSVDECARIFRSFFSSIQQSEDKSLVFFCIICLIKIYFRLKNYRNSKTPVDWVEKTGVDLTSFPKAEVTTFYYYSGRLQLYDLKLNDAQRIFNLAFNLCHKDYYNNKKLILEYLIPLNLFNGVVPSKEMLDHYKLYDYSVMVQAYKDGDMTQFELALEKIEDRLIVLGTFLIVEKLKGYVMRNLIKNIHKSYFSNKMESENLQPYIKISLIHQILQNVFNYTLLDKDELELYIVGLIYKGLINGYVHNQGKFINFSKKNPFPSLQTNFINNYNKII